MTSQRTSFWYRNGLSLVLLGMFLVFFAAQTLTGWRADNQERVQQGQPAQPLTTYLQGGHFLSATFENWESEFLQMGMYVLLTVWLRQRGSAESRELDPAQEQERVDPDPGDERRGVEVALRQFPERGFRRAFPGRLLRACLWKLAA